MPERPPFEQFSAIRRYQPTLAFSPDGDQIVYSVNTSGQFNLWAQAVDGGCPRQLTSFTDRAVRSVSWSPDGATLAFSADKDGDEFQQIFTLPARGGWPARLTHADDAQHSIGDWSPTGEHLAYTANDADRSHMDVVLREVGSGATRRLTAGGLYFFAGWSPDGEQLLATQFKLNTDQDIFLLVPGDEPQNLTAHEGQVVNIPVGWAADGRSFYLISDAGREFRGLARFELAGRRLEWAETPAWDVEQAAVSRDGERLAWVVNEDGYSRLYVRDLGTGALLPPAELPRGVVAALALSADGGRAGVLLARATEPTALYVVDTASGYARRLTEGFLAGLDPADLAEPEVVRFPSFDGREVPAFLYRPRGAEGRAPVVLSIHGGPEAQERPTYLYSGLYQYLLSRGIGVLATNVRGSTGYGKSYQRLIYRDWGGGDLQDFAAAAAYLRGLDWVDGARLGVFGGSYGGFATLSCLTRLPDLWAVGVDIVGPSNLITFVQSVPPWWRSLMDAWVGNPEADRDLLVERSPITYVEQIKAPLLVIQGAKDPRVVKAESDQMVERLRALGREVRYDVYDDEGHGFTRRPNELKAMQDAAAWLERHLLGELR